MVDTDLALGIDCGGTRTTAMLRSSDERTVMQAAFGPGNLQLLTQAQLETLLGEIASQFPVPAAVGVGMAGLRTKEDRDRVLTAMASFWPGARLLATDDLEVLLGGVPAPDAKKHVRVAVISGTGSCCFARSSSGAEAKVGGWGQRLGDEAGAYGIAVAALRAVTRTYDHDGKPPRLLERFAEHLDLVHVNDLSAWTAQASKGEVAQLAPLVFKAWSRRERVAQRVVLAAVEHLVADAYACAARLGGGQSVQYILNGGCFQKQPRYASLVTEGLSQRIPHAEFVLADGIGAVGAASMARRQGGEVKPSRPRRAKPEAASVVPESTALSPTELRLPESMTLDRMGLRDAIELMADQDQRLPGAIKAEAPRLERLIRWVVKGLGAGGRLIYTGAGTSGRLGVLDASECPPTFRTDPRMVQGLMAGGRSALWRSIEGAEDSVDAGREDLGRLAVGENDVVVGIAASGRTPYVWGCLSEARRCGAKTALICFNPNLRFQRGMKPDVVICPEIGPEVLTGSTRLKSGTATKLILNMITTLTMVKLGKVIQNLMVDVNPSNVKLRERAIRIVVELTGVSAAEAGSALEATGWRVKEAYQQIQRKDRSTRKRN